MSFLIFLLFLSCTPTEYTSLWTITNKSDQGIDNIKLGDYLISLYVASGTSIQYPVLMELKLKEVVMGRFLVVLIILGSFTWVNPASAKTLIRLGVVTIPGSAQNICADKFKELLEAKSNDYEVKIYHSASLGTETEILQQIQMNTVQMGIITDGPFDVFVPEVRVINYPFLFENYKQVDKVLDGPAGQDLLKCLENELSFRVLMWISFSGRVSYLFEK